jgi:hypothetical protein
MKPNANNLTSPNCYHGQSRRSRDIRECFCGNAVQAIGTLHPGAEIFGFTKGQFSFMDLITAILHQTGPAHVDLSTWTAGNADIEHCFQFVESGRITSTRWMVDRSFPARQPEYFDALLARFGRDSVRITNSHAKFCLIQNGEWDLCVRTSMNLNKNPRFENFEISDDPQLAAYLRSVMDEVFTNQSAGRAPGQEVHETFGTMEISGETYDQTEIVFEPIEL